jgi:hypothetical protein
MRIIVKEKETTVLNDRLTEAFGRQQKFVDDNSRLKKVILKDIEEKMKSTPRKSHRLDENDVSKSVDLTSVIKSLTTETPKRDNTPLRDSSPSLTPSLRTSPFRDYNSSMEYIEN